MSKMGLQFVGREKDALRAAFAVARLSPRVSSILVPPRPLRGHPSCFRRGLRLALDCSRLSYEL